MSDIYLTLFLIGFLYAALSVGLAGLGHVGVHLPWGHGFGDGHGHLPVVHPDAAALHHGNGHVAGGETDGAAAKPTVSPINLTIVMTFLLGFGGAGYVLTAVTAWPALLVGAGAAVAGLAEATVVSIVLTRLLQSDEGVLRASDSELVGTIARVSVPIRASGLGEIVYTRLGSRHSVGARAARDQAIDLGAEVVVTAYERGTAVVERWDEFTKEG